MTEQGFFLSSPAFEHGAAIPAVHTCEGKNISPELRWMHVPPQARSLALIMDDPDAPHGTFTHWVLYDIPPSSRGLAEGATEEASSGKNDFHRQGYGGPCPPVNHGEHRYFFKLYALDVDRLGVDGGASRKAVEAAMQGHVLDEAEWMGRFARGKVT